MKKQTYIHNTPGRLRVRTEAVRNRPAAAEAVRALVAGTPHVYSVEANPLTGSITVRYDHARMDASTLLGILRGNGYLEGSATAVETRTIVEAGRPAAAGRAAVSMTPAEALLMQAAAAKVGQIVLSWTIERAIAAAIAGLL
jgi:Heavy metal associated domain 2